MPSKRIHPRFYLSTSFPESTRNPVLTLLYVRSNSDMLLPIRGASNSEIGTSTSSFVRGFPHKPQPPTFPPLLTRHSPGSLLSLARRTRPSTHPASPKIPPPAVPQFHYPRTPVGVCAVIVLHLLLDGGLEFNLESLTGDTRFCLPAFPFSLGPDVDFQCLSAVQLLNLPGRSRPHSQSSPFPSVSSRHL